MSLWLISIRNVIIAQLKGKALKAAILTLAKSGPLLGFRVWVIKTIVKHFFDDIAEPIIKASFIQMSYTYNRIEGKILIKKLQDARNENNETDYNTNIDIILGG